MGGPVARALPDFLFEIELGGERQAGLGIGRTGATSARAVFGQPARDFAAPFGLIVGSRDGDSYRLLLPWSFIEREITERTRLGVLKQEGATL